MRHFPDECVHTCVTSPPYFGLRDYNHAGQIGLEPTPDAYVTRLVEVFREVRRVLRDDGTLWLNLGDSYAGNGGRSPQSGEQFADRTRGNEIVCRSARSTVLPNKQLLGIPWRVAFALQADGWYLRQDIIWHKPNPMPESVKDRCTKAHEYIFLFSKSPRYYFDAEAIKEDAVRAGKAPGGNRKVDASRKDAARDMSAPVSDTRNRRDVWTVSTKPYSGAHFATFPPDLVEPCVLAGAPIGGVVLDPFAGSGTVGMVASRHGRKSVGLELNPEYFELAKQRVGA
jgi:site-specific DNA-methyltransferase (adenine-specific)